MYMKIDITNLQKIKKIDVIKIRGYARNILKEAGVPFKKISVLLCDNAAIKDLNKKFFNKNLATDVISFPLEDHLDEGYLGEIVVSVEEAVILGEKYGNHWEKELVLYLIHGILHLLGDEDQTALGRENMEKKQMDILSKVVRAKNHVCSSAKIEK